MADSTLPVNLNLTPAAFSTAWSDYLVTKVTTGPYTVATHAATRHLGPTQNFIENCLLQFQEKTAKTILNVREYGALGDGATDDSAAIQDAIDAANALGGASVYLGAGTFVLDSSLEVYDGTQLLGAGQQDTILQYTSTGYAIAQSTPETRIYGIRMEGFSLTFDDGGLDLNSVSKSAFIDVKLQANSAGTGTCARIQSTASNQGLDNLFVACHFQAGAIGLQLGTGGANRNKVVACIVEDCTTGILITDGASNLIQGCTILDNTTGIQINESGGTLSQGNSIDGCMFDEQVTRNININTSGIDNTRVVNNYFATKPLPDINNGVNTYASGNVPLAAPWGVLYSDVFDVDAAGTATFIDVSIDDLIVTNTITTGGTVTVGGNIVSDTDSTDDIGTSLVRFANAYIDDIVVTDTITTGGTVTVGGDILADSDSTRDIGSSAVRFAFGYIDDIFATNRISINYTAGSAASTADDIIVGTAGAGSNSYGITILSDTTGTSQIRFGRSGTPSAGGLTYYHSLDAFQFTANATQAMLVYADRVTVTTAVPQIEMGAGGPKLLSGSGTPEGAVTADVGSIFMRTDGGAGTSMYVKESGTGNTGWVAK